MSDFPVRVDKDDATPMWIQLRDQIVDLISSGALEPEQKLPTVRDLAAQLSVSTNTVNQTYRYLRGTGYLESRQGSGVRVRKRTDFVKDEDFAKVAALVAEFVAKCGELGIPAEDVPNTVSYYVAGRNLFPKEEDGDKYAQRFLDKFSS